jgi:hypothetical protein
MEHAGAVRARRAFSRCRTSLTLTLSRTGEGTRALPLGRVAQCDGSDRPCGRGKCGRARLRNDHGAAPAARPSGACTGIVGRAAAPHGKRPTFTVLIGRNVAASMTVTSPETPLVV